MSESEVLLDEIRGSITDMQREMQMTYQSLENLDLTGKSEDGTVVIILSATYQFKDIEFDEKALQGGVKEFKWRIKEAWKNVCETVQQTTQAKTVELLQGMNIPDDIKNISVDQEDDDGQQD